MGEKSASGAGAIDAAVYGLLGLLIAFTFSGAASRFEARRHLITEEANAIGTAYLRLDMLSAEAQKSLKEKFRIYVDSRLSAYRDVSDREATKAALARSAAIQSEIWSEVGCCCPGGISPAGGHAPSARSQPDD